MGQFQPVFIENDKVKVGYAQSHIKEDSPEKLPFQLELVKILEEKVESLQLDVNLLRQSIKRLEKKHEEKKNS